MKHLRALIYKIGLRPKAGSIFYSPSLHWQSWGRKAIEQTAKHFRRK